MSKYVAEFRNVEVNDERKVTEEKKSSSQVVDKKGIDTKTVGKVLATGTALALTTSQLYSRFQSSSNSITGNSVAQRRLDNTMAYLNEGLTIVGSVGVGAIVGGPAGLAAAGVVYATRTAMNAYNTALENRVKQANWQVESIVNAEKQGRLVKDITGVRI